MVVICAFGSPKFRSNFAMNVAIPGLFQASITAIVVPLPSIPRLHSSPTW